jgi:hypothetical protein
VLLIHEAHFTCYIDIKLGLQKRNAVAEMLYAEEMTDDIHDGVEEVSFEDSVLIEASGYRADASAAVLMPFRVAYPVLRSRYDCAMRDGDQFGEDADLYRETHWIEWEAQQAALTLMALTCLQSFTMSSIISLRQHDRTPLPQREEREAEVKYATRAYKTVGIDIKRMSHYDVIDDVREARNCIVHGPAGEPSRSYLARENKRLLNSEGRISLDPDKLELLISESASFVRELGDKLHDRRTRK